MIGTDLNLTLPTLADTLTSIVTKYNTALAAIEDSIADKATPSGLSINAALSFGGNQATNVGGVTLVSGNAPVAAGSVYYSGGSFFLIDSTATIQLTANGALNVAAVGGIGGDYGGVNPAAVTFDDASGEYRFTEDPGVYADLRADDLLLMDSGFSIRVTAPTLAANYTLTLPAAVPAAAALLQMSAAGVVTASSTLATNITAPDFRFTTARVRTIPIASFIDSAASSAYQLAYWELATDATALHIPVPLEVGETITGWAVLYVKATDANDTVTGKLWRCNYDGTVEQVGTTDTDSANAPGASQVDNVGLSEGVGTNGGISYTITIQRSVNDASSGVFVNGAYVTVTRA